MQNNMIIKPLFEGFKDNDIIYDFNSILTYALVIMKKIELSKLSIFRDENKRMRFESR